MRRLLPVLLLLVSLGPTRADAASKSEERTWERVQNAAESEVPAKLLMRVEDYISTYPDGDWIVPAQLEAGRALLAMEEWQDARMRFLKYLEAGGRKEANEASFGIALCLARERRVEDATVALHNVAVNDSDTGRSRAAARELAALHAFEGSNFRALDALALLVKRRIFEEKTDLRLARKYAEDLGDDAIVAAETTRRGTPTGALLSLLAPDRGELLLDSKDTEEDRRRFASRYSDSSLLALVPGAEEFAAEPEDVRTDRIGLLLPSSGRFAAPGILARRGVDLAMEAAAELGWAPVELIAIDTQGDPAVAKAGLAKLAAEHKVVGVIGPIITAEAIALAGDAEELGLPLIMMTQQPGLSVDRANVFNTWSPPEEQAEKLVEHAMGRLGLERFAIAYPDTEVAARAAARFWERVEESGGQVVSVESFPSHEKDFRATGRRLEASHYKTSPPGEADRILPFIPGRTKPQLTDPQVALEPGVDFQAVFVPTNYKQATMVASGFLYEEINIGGHLDKKDYPPVTLMGGAAFNHPGLTDRGGKYMEGTVLVDGFFHAAPDGPGREFAEAYQARYGTPPSILEAVAHDATFHLLQMLAEGVSGRRELRRRLGVSTPMRAVTGARGFDADGVMRHELLTLTVRKGAIVQVWPPPGDDPTTYLTPTFKDEAEAPLRPEEAPEDDQDEGESPTP